MQTLAGTMTMDKELKALLIQPLHGEDREPVYSVFTEDARGKEHRREVDKDTFWRLHELAGEPMYQEPGYWTYDNAPIEWADVMVEDRVP